MAVKIDVRHGDCLEVIPQLVAEGRMVDAVVTDPPYHLVQIAERSKYPVGYGKDGAMQRLLSGFMGQTWDGGDIAFRKETWGAVANIMRPGGFLVAFGGTRTHHRMTCAIEDAGFVIQDCLMFLFATGFPKRRDMLKPAYEPIVLAYKPGGKRTMQVDECRIETIENLNGGTYGPNGKANPLPGDTRTGAALGMFQPGSKPNRGYEQPTGRWPANICHDGSDEVVAAFQESESRRGVVTSKPGQIYGNGKGLPAHTGEYGFDDSGSAARFFFSSKAGAQDRWGSRHPTVKPVELMKWLVALVCPPGGTVLDPFAGSGTTAVAALGTGRNAILIEREDQYVADIRERVAFYEGGGAHSVQAKNRNRAAHVHEGDLFAPASEPRSKTGDLGSGWDPLFVESAPVISNGSGAQPSDRAETAIAGWPVESGRSVLVSPATTSPQPSCVSDRAAPNIDPSPEYNPSLDSALSFDAAIQAIGERVKAGEPLPTGGYFGGDE